MHPYEINNDIPLHELILLLVAVASLILKCGFDPDTKPDSFDNQDAT